MSKQSNTRQMSTNYHDLFEDSYKRIMCFDQAYSLFPPIPTTLIIISSQFHCFIFFLIPSPLRAVCMCMGVGSTQWCLYVHGCTTPQSRSPEKNWLSHSEELSITSSSSAWDRTSWSPLPSTLGFCLAWSCSGLVRAVTIIVSSYKQLSYCPSESTVSFSPPIISGSDNLSVPSLETIPDPREEGVWDRLRNESSNGSYSLPACCPVVGCHVNLYQPQKPSYHSCFNSQNPWQGLQVLLGQATPSFQPNSPLLTCLCHISWDFPGLLKWITLSSGTMVKWSSPSLRFHLLTLPHSVVL